ncbi:hypothetical protein VTN00DRAFT_2499 [Thermoascus crustaceus]|uniref:uncharacterized protein n=1 Tax=Thermoascus crustaceus TaxID=5088 RepID=UPI0037430D88
MVLVIERSSTGSFMEIAGKFLPLKSLSGLRDNTIACLCDLTVTILNDSWLAGHSTLRSGRSRPKVPFHKALKTIPSRFVVLALSDDTFGKLVVTVNLFLGMPISLPFTGPIIFGCVVRTSSTVDVWGEADPFRRGRLSLTVMVTRWCQRWTVFWITTVVYLDRGD